MCGSHSEEVTVGDTVYRRHEHDRNSVIGLRVGAVSPLVVWRSGPLVLSARGTRSDNLQCDAQLRLVLQEYGANS